MPTVMLIMVSQASTTNVFIATGNLYVSCVTLMPIGGNEQYRVQTAAWINSKKFDST